VTTSSGLSSDGAANQASRPGRQGNRRLSSSRGSSIKRKGREVGFYSDTHNWRTILDFAMVSTVVRAIGGATDVDGVSGDGVGGFDRHTSGGDMFGKISSLFFSLSGHGHGHGHGLSATETSTVSGAQASAPMNADAVATPKRATSQGQGGSGGGSNTDTATATATALGLDNYNTVTGRTPVQSPKVTDLRKSENVIVHGGTISTYETPVKKVARDGVPPSARTPKSGVRTAKRRADADFEGGGVAFSDVETIEEGEEDADDDNDDDEDEDEDDDLIWCRKVYLPMRQGGSFKSTGIGLGLGDQYPVTASEILLGRLVVYVQGSLTVLLILTDDGEITYDDSHLSDGNTANTSSSVKLQPSKITNPSHYDRKDEEMTAKPTDDGQINNNLSAVEAGASAPYLATCTLQSVCQSFQLALTSELDNLEAAAAAAEGLDLM
jgi:hypothetical protein